MSDSSRSQTSSASNHSSRNLARTPRASFPSEQTSVDSAHGSDCQAADDDDRLFLAPRRESQHTFATYASTITADMQGDEFAEDGIVAAERPLTITPGHLVAASPKDFAELFPSSRRLLIRHDDTTIDGNMNLRIDTNVKTTSGQLKDMTLFHLRMHDLKKRDFSVRRYCRDSGREVCHSTRKPQEVATPPSKRSKTSGTFSSAFRKLGSSPLSPRANTDGLSRQDSGYSSFESSDNARKTLSNPETSPAVSAPLSNDLSLEFSNYARFRLGLSGGSSFSSSPNDSRHYTFEYYGLAYMWERVIETTFTTGEETSFVLTRLWDKAVLAHIAPIQLSPEDARTEAYKGGWVSPSTMWLCDRSVTMGPADVADVVVVTGLMAMVDDTIRKRFESQPMVQQGQQERQRTTSLKTSPRRTFSAFSSRLSCI